MNWVPVRLTCLSTQTGEVEGRIIIKSPAVIYHASYHCWALQNNGEKPREKEFSAVSFQGKSYLTAFDLTFFHCQIVGTPKLSLHSFSHISDSLNRV